MKTNSKFNYTLAMLSIAMFLLVSGCGKKTADTTTLDGKKTRLAELQTEMAKITGEIATLEIEVAALDPASSREKVTAVVTETVIPQTFVHSIDLQGSVKSDDEMMLSPKMPGNVTKVLIKIGDKVNAGQVIAYMDDAVMRQSIAQVQTQLDFARQNYEKLDRLWKQNIGTEVQVLGAKTQVQGLEKQIATMNEQNSSNVVRAPRSGTIDELYTKVGMPASPGVPMAKLVTRSGLKVVADIAEGYSGRIRQGNDVILNFPDLKKETKAKIGYVSQTINALNRTYRVDIPVNGADLIPNMITTIRVIDYKKENSIVIPINLIQKSEEGDYVLIAENGAAKKVPITVGQTYGDKAEVLSGLKAGNNLITVGFQSLNNGDKIKI
ncbi:MAG: efflux RND transporter periplasmic adaptor subunit [Saprospiraceae bacterium]